MKRTFFHEHETRKALSDFVSKTDMLSMGTVCAQFETAFAKWQGRKAAILFNSGGSANLALLQALKNLGHIKAGNAIGFSTLTWSTNVMPIIQTGMRPVSLDCDPKLLNVTSTILKEKIQKEKLHAVFLTNVLGFMGDLDKILETCEKKKIMVLEDNCEALGSEIKHGKSGNMSLASTFSFFVAHHMSTIEGGMVCTDDAELAMMLRIVRANGWDRNLAAREQQMLRKKYKIHSEFDAKYTFYDLAFNMRPTEITGFLGLVQLQYLDENIMIREQNHLRLEKFVNENSELISVRHDHMTRLSPFAFPVICKTHLLRDKYLSQFSGAGIEVRPMIAGNMERQPFYKKYVNERSHLPGSDFIHQNGFYCGNYPELTEGDLETISSCLYQNS